MPSAANLQSPVLKKLSLALWMDRVLEECGRASAAFDPEAVHDLRVALRRCRSLADGLIAIDPDPAWKQMKKAGRTLFRSLGDLRDVHVMQEWVQRLGGPDDPVTGTLLQYLSTREAQFKQDAFKAIADFDSKQWEKWSTTLPRRAARVRPGSPIFTHLALERWTQAHELHSRALRNRSKVSFHNLRIGLKKFRYIVENFLPEQHLAWSSDLKELQDLLGEVHDLDVLWGTALQVNVFLRPESRAHWQGTITAERAKRIENYRRRMLGKDSLWHVWRAALPQGKEVKALALARLKRWASALDPDFAHSRHVAKLALQLYDTLPANGHASSPFNPREVLQVAALLHDIGRSKTEKKSHKATYKLIARLTPPLGFSAQELHVASAVSRYHQGALPRTGQLPLDGFSFPQRQGISHLAGILRLAHAFDIDRDAHVQDLSVEEVEGYFVVAADGYSPQDRSAQQIAAARHLLETVYKRPLLVKGRAPKRGQV